MNHSQKSIANTILVEDVSASMSEVISDGRGAKQKKIDVLKDASRALLVHKVLNYPQDRVGCVIFGTKASVLFELTNPNSADVLEKIHNIRLRKRTNMVAGLSLAIELLERRKQSCLSNIIQPPNKGRDKCSACLCR